jgi:hypothetical protein
VSDITGTSRCTAETVEAEWIEGSTTPAVGARFRGHVKRNNVRNMQATLDRIKAAAESSGESGHE